MRFRLGLPACRRAALLSGLTGGLALACVAQAQVNYGNNASHRTAPAATQSANSMPSAAPLHRYVLPDQTAAVMLPNGWNVVQTDVALIRAVGTRGEVGMFGFMMPALDAPELQGQAGTPAPIHVPYSADLREKFTQTLAWLIAHVGQQPGQIQVSPARPISAPSIFGSCGRMVASFNLNPTGQVLAETYYCSMPKGPDGAYRNFFKLVAAPKAIAMNEGRMLETVLGSYQLNFPAIERQLAARGMAMPGGTGSAPAQASAGGARPAAFANQGQAHGSAPASGAMSTRDKIKQEVLELTGFTPDLIARMRQELKQAASSSGGSGGGTLASTLLDKAKSALQQVSSGGASGANANTNGTAGANGIASNTAGAGGDGTSAGGGDANAQAGGQDSMFGTFSAN